MSAQCRSMGRLSFSFALMLSAVFIASCSKPQRALPDDALPHLKGGVDLPKALFQGRLARRGPCVGLANGNSFTTIVWASPMKVKRVGGKERVVSADGSLSIDMGEQIVGGGGASTVGALESSMAYFATSGVRAARAASCFRRSSRTSPFYPFRTLAA